MTAAAAGVSWRLVYH